MSKRILIIGRSYHPDGKETADEIYKQLRSTSAMADCEVTLSHYKDLLFDISNEKISVIDTKNGFDLASFNAVLMTNWFSHASIRKDIAYALGLFWQHHGVQFFNSEALHNRSSSKLSQMMMAALNDLPIPRTIFSLSFEQLSKYADEQLGTPMIVKNAQGSRGQGNYLVKSIDELNALKPQHSERHPFLAQELINAGNIDYRFFVAGGRTRLIIKRLGSKESHLTNTSAGASTETMPPENLGEGVLDIVHQASKLLHREVTGIDIMFDKNTNKPYFLEANPIPQIATGSNVDQKIAALADALLEAASKENR